jgi:hypothetical protein
MVRRFFQADWAARLRGDRYDRVPTIVFFQALHH